MKYEELDEVGKAIAVLSMQGIVSKYDYFYENGVYNEIETVKAFEEELLDALTKAHEYHIWDEYKKSRRRNKIYKGKCHE